jgi:hypothetical protein
MGTAAECRAFNQLNGRYDQRVDDAVNFGWELAALLHLWDRLLIEMVFNRPMKRDDCYARGDHQFSRENYLTFSSATLPPVGRGLQGR